MKLSRPEKSDSSLRPLRVLIVEDSENDALLLLRELKKAAVPPELEEALYRIAQVALHNTVRHALATRVRVRMACDPKRTTSNDGLGFDTGGGFPGHLGLRSMRERAQSLGGSLEVESIPGKGTTIRAHMPLRPAVASGG